MPGATPGPIESTTPPADTYVDGVRAALPVAIAVGLFGVSFGVLARGAGFGPVAPVLMSMTTFGGSAQFAAVAVLAAGGSAITAAAAAVMLNARYLPIGITISHLLPGGPLQRLLLAQLVVDENWALAHRPRGLDGRVLLGAGAALYASWVIGTIIGVLAGAVIGNPARLGLDAAFPALFLALLVRQLRSRRKLAAAFLGAAVSLALTPFAPPGVPVLAAGLACLVGLLP